MSETREELLAELFSSKIESGSAPFDDRFNAFEAKVDPLIERIMAIDALAEEKRLEGRWLTWFGVKM